MKFGKVNDKVNEWNSKDNKAMVQTIQQCDPTGNLLKGTKATVIFDSYAEPKNTGEAKWGHSSCVGDPTSTNEQGLRINNNINNTNLTEEENSILTSRLYSPVKVNTPDGDLSISHNTTIGGKNNKEPFGWDMLKDYLKYGFYIILSWSDGNLYMPTQYDGVIANYNPNDGFVNMANTYSWPGSDSSGKDKNIEYKSPNSENPYCSINKLDMSDNDALNIAKLTFIGEKQPNFISEMIRGYPTQQWTNITQTNVWKKIEKTAPSGANWTKQGHERLPTFREAKKIDGTGFGNWTIENISIKAKYCFKR